MGKHADPHYPAPLPLSGWPLTPPLGILHPWEMAATPAPKLTGTVSATLDSKGSYRFAPNFGDDPAFDDVIGAPLAAVTDFVAKTTDEYLLSIFGDLETAQRLGRFYELEQQTDVKVVGSILHATITLKLHHEDYEFAVLTKDYESEF